MRNPTTISSFMEKGYLISPDVLDKIPHNFNIQDFISNFNNNIKTKDKPILINKDLFNCINKSKNPLEINWLEFEKSKTLREKGKNGKTYETFLDILNYDIYEEKKEKLKIILQEVTKPEEEILSENPKIQEPVVIVLKSYSHDSKKREVQDFVSYFKARYNSLKKILLNRQELQNAISINKIYAKQPKEQASIIGMVVDKQITKNNTIILNVEDLTGEIKVLISKNSEIHKIARDIILDEVIGIIGTLGDRVIYANQIIPPNIPLNRELKKSPNEVYAAFISDIHVGSKYFLKEKFEEFINWLNSKAEGQNEIKIISKIKYLFLVGDLVDGIGVYPSQEPLIEIKDIREQYNLLAELLGKIRKDIKIIICPGNHDATRLALPQPPLDKDIAQRIWDLKNVVMVSNPSLVNIQSSEEFPGFDVLLFDGYSYHTYLDEVEELRLAGGHNNPLNVMKFLLQKRHLSPTHNTSRYVPYQNEDPLVIEKVPDIFVSGEMHKVAVENYKNITLIYCGCWQSKTPRQVQLGLEPDTAVVPIINLQTRTSIIKSF